MKQQFSFSLKSTVIFISLITAFVSGVLLLGWNFHIGFIRKIVSEYPAALSLITLILILCTILPLFLKPKNKNTDLLTEREILLTSIINSSDDAILSKTLEGIIISWNHGAETIFGYSQKEMIGQHISIIIPPHLLKEEDEILEKIRKGHTINHYETERVRKDGKIIYVSLTISPIKDSTGKIVMASKIIRDISSQRKAEQDILTAYKEKEMVLTRINDAVVSIDNNWRYTFLNDAALANHPQGREVTLEKTLWEIHPELEESVFGRAYHEAMNTMKVVEVEDYYAPMNIWFSVKAYPSHDGLTIFYRNITENKKAEQELLQTLKEVTDYKYALNESSIVAITDQKGIIKYANDNFCKISKYTREELVGQDHRIINSGYHPKEYIRDLWITIVNGKIWHGELKNKAKDGTIYWVDTTIVPFLNGDGKPYQYVAIRSDITERKKTEENLERSEVRLNEAQSIAHLGSWEVDFKTGNIIWSDESCRILGVSHEEAQPSLDKFLSLIHPDDFERVSKIIRNGEGELQSTSFSCRIIREDGIARYVYSESRVEFDATDKPLRLFGILHDVTEEKIAEEERLKMINDLMQRNKDHEQFAYIVSHNLRAPVANIIGFSNALQRPGLNAEVKEKFTEGLFSASNKLDTVIKDLAHILQVSREVSENKQSVCLSDLVDNIRASMSNMIEKEQAKIYYDFAINEIDTVKTFLHSIFYNLISNSIKFRRPSVPPIIDIKSHREDGKVHLVFKDNGLGIDLRRKGPELFGLYKRFHNHIDGKGMGLFMTKTQVETMGGSILVHSIVNEGTEFVIDLPV